MNLNALITKEESELLQFSTKFLNSQKISCLLPHMSTLKEGSIVMLLWKLNPVKGLLNGRRLIVRKIYDDSLDVEIITGVIAGQWVLLPRVDFSVWHYCPTFFKQRQFSIWLALCMTMSKKGQTLNRVGIYLSEPNFSCKQLHVVLSCAKSFKKVKVRWNLRIDVQLRFSLEGSLMNQ